jgi:CRISPR-associated protein Cmr4
LVDLDFSLQQDKGVTSWAQKLGVWLFSDSGSTWQAEFSKRFAVVADDTFNFFSETATEVNARVRMEPSTKKVADGALWYEEALPAESILAGLVWCDKDYSGQNRSSKEIMDRFCRVTQNLQIGGKATVGRGRVRCIFGGANA